MKFFINLFQYNIVFQSENISTLISSAPWVNLPTKLKRNRRMFIVLNSSTDCIRINLYNNFYKSKLTYYGTQQNSTISNDMAVIDFEKCMKEFNWIENGTCDVYLDLKKMDT